MEHSFDIHLAKEIGLSEAIMMKHFIFWISKNKHNKKHHHDGHTWTYNSVSAFGGLFPYLTKHQISRSIKSLEKQNIIKSGNYNQLKYDRTKWFAIVDEQRFLLKQKCNSSKTEMQSDKKQNAFNKKEKPIPYTKNTDTKTIYKMSIDIYHKFCLSNFDAPAKIDSVQGKAMKSILSYLKTLCKQKGDDSQENILNALKDYQGRIKVTLVPNLTNICYGRGVGYKIEEIVLDEKTQQISATKIREQMRKDGKLK